jgi:hypothetical protein
MGGWIPCTGLERIDLKKIDNKLVTAVRSSQWLCKDLDDDVLLE